MQQLPDLWLVKVAFLCNLVVYFFRQQVGVALVVDLSRKFLTVAVPMLPHNPLREKE